MYRTSLCNKMSRGNRLRNLVSILIRNLALSQQTDEPFQDPQSLGDEKSELDRVTRSGKYVEHLVLALSNDLRSIMPSKIYSANLERSILENTIIPVEHSQLRVCL